MRWSSPDKRILARRGFTLVELLIYIAILSVMTIIVADTFLMLSKGQGNIEAKSELNSNFNFAVEKIKRDIAAASALNTPFTAGGNAAILNLTVAGSTVEYALAGGRLTRRVDLQAPENITSERVNITSLDFVRRENNNTPLARKTISVVISLGGAYNSTSPDWQSSRNLQTTVNLNKDFAF